MDKLIEKMGCHFIGLWQFRNYNKPREWCVTYQVNGFYYDTYPKGNAVDALNKALVTLSRMKARKIKKRRKDCDICSTGKK